MAEIEETVREFLVETHENLDKLDLDFLQLERDPANQETVARIFRAIHTLKGTAGCLGFTRLESLANAGENVLSALRAQRLALSPELSESLLGLVDAVRKAIAQIEASGLEGAGDDRALTERLDALARAADEPAAPSVPALALGAAAGAPPPDPSPAAVEEPELDSGAALYDQTVRVDVGLLDKLMNLVGELVLARNQILQFGPLREDPTVGAASQRLDLVTTELQEGVMKTRMQPIGSVWRKFPRAVHDLALGCQKRVRLELRGEETELDRTIIQAIRDPLTHLVRNAIDHGLEAPEVRVARGKPVEGRLTLSAYHEGGQVNIEVSDDGAGLDLERLRQLALQRGAVSHEQALRMSEREAAHLVFLPGLSTSRKVTALSGRGVGMDVVKSSIERIGGVVDVRSVPGEGCTVRLKIPLTLAIIPALVVSSARQRFAIPQVSLLELVRLDAERADSGIESIHGTPVYRRRGSLLPLVHLGGELGLADPEAGGGASRSIVVVESDGRPFGLVVDAVLDTEEIVVKPLGSLLKGISVFAGATILGDGRVALIVDVLGLAQRAGVVSESRERLLAVAAEAPAPEAPEQLQTLLLCSGADDGRLAIPLSEVARLEKLPASSVERIGGQQVVQYRGQILPLVGLAQALPERRLRQRAPEPEPARERLDVVVFARAEGSVGLVVERILDVVEESVQVRRPAVREGVLYSAVIRGRVTEMLDVEHVLRAADPTRPEPQPRF